MKKFKLILASLAFVVLSATAILVPEAPVGAVNALEGACSASGDSTNPICNSTEDDATNLIEVLVNVLLFLIGTLSVIMLIWGGIRYTTSAGNATSVAAAKNTIMYAIIGLVVAFLAYAIVFWVLDIFKTTP
jgi:hypothetical protein